MVMRYGKIVAGNVAISPNRLADALADVLAVASPTARTAQEVLETIANRYVARAFCASLAIS